MCHPRPSRARRRDAVGEHAGDEEADRADEVGRPDEPVLLVQARPVCMASYVSTLKSSVPTLDRRAPPGGVRAEPRAASQRRLAQLERGREREEDRADEEDHRVGADADELDDARERPDEEAEPSRRRTRPRSDGPSRRARRGRGLAAGRVRSPSDRTARPRGRASPRTGEIIRLGRLTPIPPGRDSPGNMIDTADSAVSAPLRIVVADDSYLVREALVHLLGEHAGGRARGGLRGRRRAARRRRPSSRTWCSPTSGCRRRGRTRASRSRTGCARRTRRSASWWSASTRRRSTRSRCSSTAPTARVPAQGAALGPRPAHRRAAGGGGRRLRRRLEGGRGADRRAAARDASPLGELTPRELEILSEIAQGKTNQAIAQQLFLTKRAVEKHINAIFLKLGLDERGGLQPAREGGAHLPRPPGRRAVGVSPWADATPRPERRHHPDRMNARGASRPRIGWCTPLPRCPARERVVLDMTDTSLIDVATPADPWAGRPSLSLGVVPRPRLVAALAATGPGCVAVLSAPAGYGKTTLLCQWEAADPRPFGWLEPRRPRRRRPGAPRRPPDRGPPRAAGGRAVRARARRRPRARRHARTARAAAGGRRAARRRRGRDRHARRSPRSRSRGCAPSSGSSSSVPGGSR